MFGAPAFRHSLWRRANAWNFSLKNPQSRRPIYIINSVDKTRLFCKNLPPTQHHSELNLQSLLPRSCQAYSHYSTIWRCQLWQTKLKLHFELKHFVLQRFKYQLSALLTIHSYYFRLENLLWNQTISLVWYFSVSFPPFTWKKFDIINRNHQGKNL